MTLEQVKSQDQAYILHTYGRVDAALVKGRNARAWDVDGKEYIDFTAGIGVNALGYCDPEWSAAVAGQAGKIQHMCNYYYCPENTALAQELSRASGMAKAFFCNSGAEANECAVKIARKYGEKRGAYRIVTLENSFHGRTLTTLAATGQEGFHREFLPLTEGFLYAQAGDLAGIQALLDGSVCAVMLEMVQGEGGVIPMDEGFVQGLAQLCREKDVLLLIDEVQTGIGRTGRFFAYQGYGVQPDVVTCAKGIAGGLPMGACLVSERLGDILQPGQNGSTFGGNPIASAAARVVVRRVSEPDFLQSVLEKGAYFREKLEAMPQVEYVRGRGLMLGVKLKEKDAHDVLVQCAKAGLLILTAKELVRRVSEPAFLQSVAEKGAYFREKLEAMPQVEYVRGRGLMLGVKLKEKDAHDVLVQCAKAGLLILTAKELVRFLPPLTITQEDIDQGLAIFQQVLAQ